MNKKTLFVFVGLLAIAIFAVPVSAKPTQTPITYFKETDYVISTEWRYPGESHIFLVTESIRGGSIYEGTDNTGPKLFDFIQIGKMMSNPIAGKQVWYFDVVYTSTSVNGGFEGVLNGQANSSNPNMFTVHGILQGFGDLKGQKLVVEVTRTTPSTSLITGMLVTP